MNENQGYCDPPWEEMLDGEMVLMSPRPRVNDRIGFNIARSLANQLEEKGKKCEVFADGVDVTLSKKDRVVPDAMIICNKNIIKDDGIYGVLDFIVEVLSPSTRKRDRGYKRDLYEKSGVREYWIVSPTDHTVEVYILKDGKFDLDEIYEMPPNYDCLDEEERKIYKTVIPVSLYNDVFVPLKSIFRNVT